MLLALPIFSMIASALRPSNAITPALHSVIVRSAGAGVGLLADRHQPVALDQQPAVAGRIGGAKAEHGERCAVLQRRAHPLEGLGRDQRRIAERDQKIVGAAGDRLAGRQHRMRGAEALALNEGRGIRPHPR